MSVISLLQVPEVGDCVSELPVGQAPVHSLAKLVSPDLTKPSVPGLQTHGFG